MSAIMSEGTALDTVGPAVLDSLVEIPICPLVPEGSPCDRCDVAFLRSLLPEEHRKNCAVGTDCVVRLVGKIFIGAQLHSIVSVFHQYQAQGKPIPVGKFQEAINIYCNSRNNGF